MNAYDEADSLLEELDRQLGLASPTLGFRVEEAWFDEEGILKILISMPLDPDLNEAAAAEPARFDGGPSQVFLSHAIPRPLVLAA